MQPSVPSDIFFTLGSIVLVIVGILLILFLVYAIRIIRALREARGAISKAKMGALALRPGIIGKSIVITSIVRRVLSFFMERKRNKPRP